MKRHRKSKQSRLTLKGLAQHRRNRMNRLENAAHAVCAAIVCVRLIRKIAEKIPSVTFPSGGFVPPHDAPKVGVAQMQGGEIVLPKSDILKKFGTFKVEPIDLGRIDIASKNASFDILTYLAKKAEGLQWKD